MQKPRWGGERPSSPRRGRWSAEEIERFKELYGLKDEAAIARELQRSVQSVRRVAEQVFGGKPRSGPWTDEEVSVLKKYLGASPVETIARIMMRTVEDVERQVAELARVRQDGPWAPEDLSDFKRIYGTRSDEDLAIIFGRRVDAIRACARDLCISKDKSFLRRRSGGRATTRMPRWQRDELEVLRELYESCSNLEIARRLDRSVKSVVSKAHNMGLKKNPDRLREMGRQNVSLRYRKGEES